MTKSYIKERKSDYYQTFWQPYFMPDENGAIYLWYLWYSRKCEPSTLYTARLTFSIETIDKLLSTGKKLENVLLGSSWRISSRISLSQPRWLERQQPKGWWWTLNKHFYGKSVILNGYVLCVPSAQLLNMQRYRKRICEKIVLFQ